MNIKIIVKKKNKEKNIMYVVLSICLIKFFLVVFLGNFIRRGLKLDGIFILWVRIFWRLMFLFSKLFVSWKEGFRICVIGVF